MAINPLTGQQVPDSPFSVPQTSGNQPFFQTGGPVVPVLSGNQPTAQPPVVQAQPVSAQPIPQVQTLTQSAPAPATGLIGAEQALRGGLSGALSGIETGIDIGRRDLSAGQQSVRGQLGRTISESLDAQRQALELIQQGVQGGVGALSGFADPGVQATQTQAAISGALGPEAQRQAFATFTSSPGQQFLTERAEQALLRGQAAIGGLGGGRARQELQRQAIGLAQQDLQNQFARLGEVSGRGLQAAGQQAGILGQGGVAGAGTVSELERARGAARTAAASQLAQLASQQAQLAAGAGTQAGQAALGTGQQLAASRTRAGEQVSSAIGGTTSALSNLLAQQGAGVSDITGTAAGNLANILQQEGQQQASQQLNLAQLLSGLSTDEASRIVQLVHPQAQAPQETLGSRLGGIGALASGLGGLILGLG